MRDDGAGGRGRLAALVVAVLVAGAVLYLQGTDDARVRPDIAAPAGGSTAPAAVPPPPPAELLAAVAPPADPRIVDLALPAGSFPEHRLQVRTIWAGRAISAMFPEIATIGGYREDPLRWHPDGLAIDVMIPDHSSAAGIELGNQVAGFALANAKRWGVLHVIWRQAYYPGIGAPTWTADYGSETLNHYDHVHIATAGGGFPTGRERFYIGHMESAAP